MPAYRVITLRNVGNDKDGYEVNDASTTGFSIQLPPDLEPGEKLPRILWALKQCGFLSRIPQSRHLKIESGDRDITIRQRRNGRYLWELRQS